MHKTKHRLEKMPKNLHRSLSDYLSKIKRQTPQIHISPSSLSSTTSRIFSGCKHPRSLSFSVQRHVDPGNRDQNQDAATLEDIDRFLLENFSSLYGKGGEEDGGEGDNDQSFTRKNKGKVDDCHRDQPLPEIQEILFDEPPQFFRLPPDLCGSHRFFVSTSSSSSLIEDVSPRSGNMSEDMMGSTSTNTATYDPNATPPATAINHSIGGTANDEPSFPVDDCIAILAASPSPYDDFRRSMQEVIGARIRHEQRVDWDFMEELLFCYLRLNEKKQYKYILGAFVDLIVDLRRTSSLGGMGS